jgi:hypothetical protein
LPSSLAASSSASAALSQTTPISVFSCIDRGSRLSEPMNTECRSKRKVFACRDARELPNPPFSGLAPASRIAPGLNS